MNARVFQKLSQRDRTTLETLKVKLNVKKERWMQELEELEKSGTKAELEAIRDTGGRNLLIQYFADKIRDRQWL